MVNEIPNKLLCKMPLGGGFSGFSPRTQIGIKPRLDHPGLENDLKSQTHSQEQSKDDIDWMSCPIGGYPITDPRLGKKCGHMFQKEEIENWIERKQTCPLCNIKLELNDLTTFDDYRFNRKKYSSTVPVRPSAPPPESEENKFKREKYSSTVPIRPSAPPPEFEENKFKFIPNCSNFKKYIPNCNKFKCPKLFKPSKIPHTCTIIFLYYLGVMVWFWVMFYTEWKTKDCFVKKHKIDNYKNKFQIVMAICTKSKTKCDNFIYDETYLENDVDELMNELKNEHPINSEIKCYYNWFLHEIELRKSAADDYSHLGTLMIIPIGIGFLLYLIIMDINGE